MTMYLSPYRRLAKYRDFQRGDRLVRYPGYRRSDVHVPLDVKTEGDAFVINCIVPGLKPEELEIEILNTTVDIRGEFTNGDVDEETYLLQELPTGRFHRYIKLPTELNASKAEANLENGILTLRIPKVEAALPKSIKVKTK